MSIPRLGRLLIVDDEIELMTILCETLIGKGYEAAGFTSGKEALEALEGKEFDLLLTDLMMPEMDGIALLRVALCIDPHLVGIIMTGQGTVQTAVDAMKVGAFDYVLKPFKLNALLPVLDRAMEIRRLRMENLKLQETVAIYELSTAIAYTLDLNTLLNKTVEAARQQLGADEVSLMLPTPEGNELYVAAVCGEHREKILGERVPLEQGIAGWVARHQEPLTLEGEVSDPRFAPLHSRTDIGSAIAMPMLAGGKLVGVLNATVTRRRPSFTLGQVKALSILVSTAAAALESARLYTQVQQAEKKYRSIFENAVEGIFQSTPDGRCLTANPAAVRMLGYESLEELRTKITAVARQLYVDPERLSELNHLLGEQGIVQGFECQFYRKDGGLIWVSMNLRAVHDAGGALLYHEGTIEEITEHKRTEERLQKAYDELRQTQLAVMQQERLRALGQMASGIAHDINNALSPIVGFADLLLVNEPDLSARTKRYLKDIYTAGEDIAHIVARMREFYRKRTEREPLFPIDLQSLVRQVIDLTSPRWKDIPQERGTVLEVHTDLQKGLPSVMGVESEVREALINLILNSADAMPEGGRITIRTRMSLEACVSNGERMPTHVILEVSDTGIGMDKETRQRCLEPFFSTKGEHGTGLGLAMVYGVMQRHEGEIDIESEPGQGTTIRLIFPVRAALERGNLLSNGLPGPSRPLRILCIDDEPLLRKLIKEMLESEGHTVEVADGGQAGLAAFRTARERSKPFEAVLTDLGMPYLNGREVAQAIKRESPSTPVILLTGWGTRMKAESDLPEQVDYVLSKPPRISELRRAMGWVTQTS